MNKGEVAERFFKEGYNCSQSVLLAFAEEVGLTKETALKISSSFGGGMGRLREVCGAVSGMFMVAGIKKGYTDPNDQSKKMEHYALIQRMAKSFSDECGSIICRELLDTEDKSPTPSKRTEEYYKKRPCGELVRIAAEITQKILFEEN